MTPESPYSPAGEHGPAPEPPGRERARALARVRRRLLSVRHVAITTHVNADGDGAGSEAAMAHFLRDHGVRATIVNPTPFPDHLEFLLDEAAWTPADDAGEAALSSADLLLVLDTSEFSRLGAVASHAREMPLAVMDHHPWTEESLEGTVARDLEACATGELVYDLVRLEGEEPTLVQARGIYVALVSDTGSFRYGNSSPRAHRIAARLVEKGVDVEAMFRALYAQRTPGGLELLRRVLATLETDPALPLAWASVRDEDVRQTGATAADREELVEYPRRIRDVQVAVLFRTLPGDRTKVSLRSNGPVDVADIAGELGGGGHPQAAGALVGLPLAEARERVLEKVRTAVRARFPEEED